jgi:hypothetical protein
MREYYLNGFAWLKEVARVWEVILAVRFPAVAANLANLGDDPMTYVAQWFLTGFQALQFPPVFKLRLFDRFVAFGTRALLSLGIAIVDAARDTLETAAMHSVTKCLQDPGNIPKFKNWRNIIKR